MEREDMIAKVKALWAKADDPACTPEEASAFRNKAADMMARYEIQQIDIATNTVAGGNIPIVWGMVKVGDGGNMLVADQRILLMGSVARHHECKILIMPHGPNGEPGTFTEIIGYQDDFDSTRRWYLDLVMDLLEGLMTENLPRGKQDAYAEGYIDRIDRRLGEFMQRVKDIIRDEYDETSGVGLAIMSRAQRVKAEFDRLHPPETLGRAKHISARYDPDAAARGRARADKFNFNPAAAVNSGGSKQALGQAKKELGR